MLLCRQLARQVGSAQIMLCNCVVTAVILVPVVAHSGAIDLPHSITGWLIIAGMAVGCQIFGHGLLVYALVEIPASFASIAILASPVISALSAWMLFGEVVTLRQFAGSALVVVGLGAASLSEVQRTAGSRAANATSRLR
jgi:drug/metabolite transporter (DMT)-like permease